MDFSAIATLGFFPTPTPTDLQRMAYAASWGYLSTAPAPPESVGATRFLNLGRKFISFGRGFFKI